MIVNRVPSSRPSILPRHLENWRCENCWDQETSMESCACKLCCSHGVQAVISLPRAAEVCRTVLWVHPRPPFRPLLER
jgi:hypothetical protein